MFIDFLGTFVLVFLIIYLLYLFTVILNKKKMNKIFETKQAMLIINPNKLDVNKINKTIFVNVMALANSFIVALTFAFCDVFIKNYIVKLGIAFVLLISLIFCVYKIIGIVYKKKEGK